MCFGCLSVPSPWLASFKLGVAAARCTSIYQEASFACRDSWRLAYESESELERNRERQRDESTTDDDG